MFDEKKIEEIKKAKKEWTEGKVEKAISRFPERKEKFTTGSNLEVDRLYTPADIEDFDYEEKLGLENIHLPEAFNLLCIEVGFGL